MNDLSLSLSPPITACCNLGSDIEYDAQLLKPGDYTH